MNYLNDKKVLRNLALEYAEFALDSKNKDNIKLHAAVNDLQLIRPIVLIDEIPWNEMNFDNSLTLTCENQYLRQIEQNLRRCIFKCKYIAADYALTEYIPVKKIINTTGFGVDIHEETLLTDVNNDVVSHKYEDQFVDDNDLEKLHNPVITYNHAQILQNYNLLNDIIGDIIPVKITGEATGYSLGCVTWDIIAMHMGIDNLLYNLIDKPELMHRLAHKFTEIFLSIIYQYEQLNLFDGNAMYIHSTCASSNDLISTPIENGLVKAKNVWGRGLAQIFSTVSPDMHDEFDITYMKKAMEPFGLVYYGCCEPLDKKIDILRQIPHLRKISISPWADINIAAQAIKKDYVISAKPNPALLAQNTLDHVAVEKEMTTILNACYKNNCSFELVLKDISTVCNNPQNLIEWEKIVMSLIR